MLGEPLDRPALAGGVPALEEEDHLLVRRLHPVLHLEQLDLQRGLLPFVRSAGELPLVGVLPGLEEPADGVPVAFPDGWLRPVLVRGDRRLRGRATRFPFHGTEANTMPDGAGGPPAGAELRPSFG